MNNALLAAWLAWLGVFLAFLGFDLLRQPDQSFIRSMAGIENKNSWTHFAEAVGPVVAAWFPAVNMEQLRRKLIWAGEPLGITAEGYIGLKILGLIAGICLGGLLSAVGLPSMLIPALGILAYFIPDYFLTDAVTKRRNSISREMPSMAGLLSTAVKAGVELGPALEAVSKSMAGPLGDEMRRSWREMVTGQPRAVALRAMAKRTGVTTVERIVETIVTAEERGGVNISDALQTFMQDIRASQSRKAQEAARKIPTKMLLPLVVCLFIPMLAMLGTPVAFMIMKAL
ncbi:MAG: type II secretion system F family protein [Bacillota bacterium]